MSQFGTFFGPSQRALAFGEQYADVLRRWGELFLAASELVGANVALGRAAAESGKEFEEWVRQTANAPWSWLSPDAVQRFMAAMGARPPTA